MARWQRKQSRKGTPSKAQLGHVEDPGRVWASQGSGIKHKGAGQPGGGGGVGCVGRGGELQQPHLSRAALAAAGCTRDSHCVTDQDDKRKGRKGQ